MNDQWLKPDFQEIGVSGECTAYAGTQSACETKVIDDEPNEPEASATDLCRR